MRQAWQRRSRPAVLERRQDRSAVRKRTGGLNAPSRARRPVPDARAGSDRSCRGSTDSLPPLDAHTSRKQSRDQTSREGVAWAHRSGPRGTSRARDAASRQSAWGAPFLAKPRLGPSGSASQACILDNAPLTRGAVLTKRTWLIWHKSKRVKTSVTARIGRNPYARISAENPATLRGVLPGRANFSRISHAVSGLR